MSNVIDLSGMLGGSTTHRYTLAGKELPYLDPTFEESGQLQRLARSLTLVNIYKLTREHTTICLGDTPDKEWFDGITLKEAVDFVTFMQNPADADSPEPEPEPITVKLDEHTVLIPPVDMAAIEAFGAWLEKNPGALMDELRAFQLKRLREILTLEDGSELPPELVKVRIPKPLGERLLDLHLNGDGDKTKKVLPKPKRTAKGKRDTGLN